MSRPTKTQKRRARRNRVQEDTHGPDLPVDGPTCIYIVLPVVPAAGTVGPRAEGFADFIKMQFEPWLAENNLLTKGLSIKLGRGKSIPTLMKEDLIHLQRTTVGIQKLFRRFTFGLLGYGIQLSVGKMGDTPLEIISADEAPGEQHEIPKPRTAVTSLPQAGRPAGGSSSSVN